MLSSLLRRAIVGLASCKVPRLRGAERARAAALEALVALALVGHPLRATLDRLDGARAAEVEDDAKVVKALRGCPTSCLVRSLAGYAILHPAGGVRFVMGVRLEGETLIGHAWLERDGVPLGEAVDPRTAYATLFTHPPLARTDGEAPTIMPSTQPRPSPDVLLTELPDGTGVLLHLGSKFYYALNRTGLVVWKRLAAGESATPDALAAALAAEFAGVVPEQARAEVVALLRELTDEGLLLGAPSPEPG